jgi:hypothetical protein
MFIRTAAVMAMLLQRYKYRKTGAEIVKLAVVDDGIGIKE